MNFESGFGEEALESGDPGWTGDWWASGQDRAVLEAHLHAWGTVPLCTPAQTGSGGYSIWVRDGDLGHLCREFWPE